MPRLEKTIVLLPVFKPGPHLSELVTALLTEVPEPARVVIVDDGTGSAADDRLTEIEALGCTVLRLAVNQGKGVALKAGFQHVRSQFPGSAVVCADGDGQHSVADIRAVAERVRPGRIVLGVRCFDRMPPRSRFGNTVTQAVFRAATGRTVTDTQTGLRAYPADLIGRLCEVPGERFEYEMNVLLDAAATGHPIDEVPIPATYLGGNAGSHFSGLTDSARIYLPLLRYAVLSRTERGPGPGRSGPRPDTQGR
ncbi:glycosyltransferase family 2 protein [Actinoplanes sp. NPDC020271]|uniref:glycosyltransferase family 2 protein n=1 Tax=Actinoplanes sp. NPDC020271 TaxID=3363896 RepID=UPI0037A1E4D9